MHALSRGKGNAMEDFLTSFFITPFTSLGEGLAAATSPLDVIDAVDGFVWGPIMILLLLSTHIFMTIRTGFIQRKLGTGIKLSVTKDDPSDADGDITQFGALTTALAATIGTGNIVGVGTGLLFGGPGAIFWMWITGILGIATKYSEVFIGVKYRVKDHSGKMLGGAMYALERGFKNKKLGRVLAVLFALFASLAAFGIGASTQSNSLADALYNTSLIDGAAIPQWLVGIVVVALVAIVILGGIKSISRVCEKLVPVMAIFYVACCIIIIGINGQFLGEAIRQIIVGAFTPGRRRWRRGWFHGHARFAVRFQTRHFLQRIGHGLGSVGCVFRHHEEPRSPGARFHDRYVLGHRRCLLAHGSHAHDHAARQPRTFHRHRERRHFLGRRPCYRGLREDSRIRPVGAARWSDYLHLLHHSWLEPSMATAPSATCLARRPCSRITSCFCCSSSGAA